MTKHHALTSAIAALTLSAFTTDAGPLDPPPGPVESTGPTQILTLPYTIDESGSYRLARDVEMAEGDAGITVTVDNVTIDLGDHVMSNGAGFGPSAFEFPGTRSSITIRGGLLIGWTALLDETAQDEGDQRILIEDMRCGDIFRGIDAPTGRGFTLRRVEIETLGPGIVVDDMARIEDCDIMGVEGVRAEEGISVGTASVVEGCRVELDSVGIEAQRNSQIRDVIVMDTQNTGIDTAAGCTVSGATVTDAGTAGISSTSTALVRDTVVNETGADGLQIGPDSRIADTVSHDASLRAFDLSNGESVVTGVVGTDADVGVYAFDTINITDSYFNAISTDNEPEATVQIGDGIFSGSVAEGDSFFIGPSLETLSGRGFISNSAILDDALIEDSDWTIRESRLSFVDVNGFENIIHSNTFNRLESSGGDFISANFASLISLSGDETIATRNQINNDFSGTDGLDELGTNLLPVTDDFNVPWSNILDGFNN